MTSSFFANAHGVPALILFGALTLVLGGGDAFRLVPRIIKAFQGDSEKLQWWAGLGLMISSVTMTVFYVLLFYVWRAVFPGVSYPASLSVAIWAGGLARVALCLFPQNNWFRPEGNFSWAVWQNLPFAATGLCLAALFLHSGNTGGYGLWKMSVAIAISFACYFPVVPLAKKKPMGWDADDPKNHGLYLADHHGSFPDCQASLNMVYYNINWTLLAASN